MSFATVMHWERQHCRTYLSGRKLKAYNCAAASARVQRPREEADAHVCNVAGHQFIFVCP